MVQPIKLHQKITKNISLGASSMSSKPIMWPCWIATNSTNQAVVVMVLVNWRSPKLIKSRAADSVVPGCAALVPRLSFSTLGYSEEIFL